MSNNLTNETQEFQIRLEAFFDGRMTESEQQKFLETADARDSIHKVMEEYHAFKGIIRDHYRRTSVSSTLTEKIKTLISG
jgi:hypothetical protein